MPNVNSGCGSGQQYISTDWYYLVQLFKARLNTRSKFLL